MTSKSDGDVVVRRPKATGGAPKPRVKRARPRGLGMVSGRQLRKLLDLGERQLSRLLAGVVGVQRGAGGRNPRAPVEEVLKELHRRASGRREQGAGEGELFGPDVDALEKLREEQFREKKRKNDIAEGLQVPFEKLDDDLGEGTMKLQQRLDAIATAYGPDCAKAINNAIDELKREWIKKLDAIKKQQAPSSPGAA